MKTRTSAKRTKQAFRPEMLGLEQRMMMASDIAVAYGQTVEPISQIAASVFLSEATALLVGEPLPERTLERLVSGLQQGKMSREVVFQNIMRTPQFRRVVVQDLTNDLLNREPTATESRRLIVGMQQRGFDLPWAIVQIMSQPEYYRANGGNAAAFVQAATSDLLNRPATSEESAAALAWLTRGGAAARLRFLNALVRGEEFLHTRTTDAALKYIGDSYSDEQYTSFRQAFQGPAGHSMMLARVLDTAAADPSGIIPTLEQHAKLSAKRVPGFLPGADRIPKIDHPLPPNLAAPYNLFNSDVRTIDSKSVDYWMITLNEGDALHLVTVDPEKQTTETDLSLRVWGPDNRELGPALTGGDFTFVATTAGTFTLGISTKDNTAFKLSPNDDPTPSGPTQRSFQAQFHVYPGAKTDTFGIIGNYRNEAYTDDGWRAWTANEAKAYETFRKIAVAGGKTTDHPIGDARLTNFTDFRHVGDIDSPTDFENWLAATWEPFDYLKGNRTVPTVVADTYAKYPVIQAAFETVSEFQTIADDFLHKQSVLDAYDNVHQLLANANEMRSNIEVNFIKKFLDWSTSNEIAFGDEPTDIYTLMKDGRAVAHDTPPTTQSNIPWIERLMTSVVTIGAGLASYFGTPAAGLAVSAAGNALVNVIDAWIEGRFSTTQPKPDPKPLEKVDIAGRVIEMKQKALDDYKNAFDMLTSTKFLTKTVFSNYGLLEAMGTARFSYSTDDSTKPADTLRKGYELTVWQELLPRMYSWRPVYLDQASSTMPKFTNFIPSKSTSTWENLYRLPPFSEYSYYDSWNYYGPNTWTRPADQVTSEATRQLVALQNGQQFAFSGYDFSLSNGNDKDWYGPGAISPAMTLTGNQARFYAIATNANLHQTLWRWNSARQSWWWTDTSSDGVSIQEWSLQTPDGNGGWLELSRSASENLFGKIPGGGLVPADPNLKSYTGGVYMDFEVPSDGLVSRFDVFSNWGQGFKDFSPRSFRPAEARNGAKIYFDPNPNNYWNTSFLNYLGIRHYRGFTEQYADFSLSYRSTGNVRGGRPFARPTGPQPEPREPRLPIGPGRSAS